MAIVLPQRWRRQPGAAVPVDWGNPLCRGLVLAGFKNAFATDLAANRSQWTLNGALTHPYTQCGAAWGFDGTASYLSRADALPATTNRAFTMACLVTPRGTLATDRRIFAFGSSTDNLPIATLQTNGTTASTATFWCRSTDNQLTQASVASELVNGRESLLIGVLNGTAQSIHTRSGSGSATAATSAAIPTDRTALGCLLRSTTASFFQGDVSWWAAWNRALTADEIQRVLESPWSVFTPQRRRLFVSAPAASGALAGTADMAFGAGSSTLVGGGALAGTAAITFTAAATLVGDGVLSGASAVVFGGTATMLGSGALAATAAITFTPSGTLAGAASIAGVCEVTFTPSGTLDLPAGMMAGTASIALGATATLAGSGALAGSSAIAFGGSATLLGNGPLAGTVPITFAPQAALLGSGALAGVAAVVFGGVGTPEFPEGVLAGTATISFSATATISAAVPGRRAASHHYGEPSRRAAITASTRPTTKPTTRPRRI